jgi:hypothetical protein
VISNEPVASGRMVASGRTRRPTSDGQRPAVRNRPKHAPRVPFALLVLGLIVGGMCALLVLNTASAANELARHDLAARDAAIAAQVQQLQNQVAASAAPGALGNAAAALGMVPAGNPAFLQIEPNGSIRVLGSPAAASPTAVPQATAGLRTTAPATTTTTAVKGTAHPTGTARGPGGTAKSPSPTPNPTPTGTPTPTATPTPTTTLPGGPR